MELSEVKQSRFTEQEGRRFKRRLKQFLVVASLTLFLFGVFCHWGVHESAGWVRIQQGEPYRLVIVTQLRCDNDSDEPPLSLSERLNLLTQESDIEIVRQAQWWATSDPVHLRTVTKSLSSPKEMQASIWNLEGEKVAENLDAFCAGDLIANVDSDENGQLASSASNQTWSVVRGLVKPSSLALNVSESPKDHVTQRKVSSESVPVITVYGVSELLNPSPHFQLSIPASLAVAASVLIVALAFGFCCRHFEDRVTPDKN